VQYGYIVTPNDDDFAWTGRVSGTTHFEGSNWLFADGHVKYKLKSKADEMVGTTVDYYWLRVKP